MGNCLVYKAVISSDDEKEYKLKPNKIKFSKEEKKLNHPSDAYNKYISQLQFERASVHQKMLS